MREEGSGTSRNHDTKIYLSTVQHVMYTTVSSAFGYVSHNCTRVSQSADSYLSKLTYSKYDYHRFIVHSGSCQEEKKHHDGPSLAGIAAVAVRCQQWSVVPDTVQYSNGEVIRK